MLKLIRKNIFFFIPYILILIFCVYLLIVHSKSELHTVFNKANSDFFDVFFKYITHIGNGLILAGTAVIFLFYKFRYALILLCSGIFTSAIINLLKFTLLKDNFRPAKYFELYESYHLHLVEGLNMHYNFSFPSGHTGSAFTLILMLTLLTDNKLLKLVFLLFACLAAYSRVYLSQHFLIDVVAGSIIGVSILLLLFYGFHKSERAWLEKSIIRFR